MTAGANASHLQRAAAQTAARHAQGGAVVDLGFADGGRIDDSERPYKVLGPNKIWMSKSARAFARQYGLRDAEMARYLMQRERLREAGVTDADVPRFGESEENEDIQNW